MKVSSTGDQEIREWLFSKRDYLKLTGCPAGLLMNFNSPTLKAGLKRVDHPDRYVKKTT